jgi:Lrp/AsnC family transcriptional regulator
MHALDDMDRYLLRLMQEEADRPVAELARQVGSSAGACWRRIERMQQAGIIRGKRVEIDWRRLGYEVCVFLRVTLDKTAPRAFDEFLAAAREVREVHAIQTLIGRVDVRMDVRARDLAHYHEIYRSRILALPHISEIEALMLVSELKNTSSLPV